MLKASNVIELYNNSIFRLNASRNIAKIILNVLSGNLCARLAPTGAVTILVMIINANADRFT